MRPSHFCLANPILCRVCISTSISASTTSPAVAASGGGLAGGGRCCPSLRRGGGGSGLHPLSACPSSSFPGTGWAAPCVGPGSWGTWLRCQRRFGLCPQSTLRPGTCVCRCDVLLLTARSENLGCIAFRCGPIRCSGHIARLVGSLRGSGRRSIDPAAAARTCEAVEDRFPHKGDSDRRSHDRSFLETGLGVRR